jgi:non-canonical (house-cleaning) NTP pyrophosphatase
MERIIVAVGSRRPPKLNAVSEALKAWESLLPADAAFEVVGVDVPSGVGDTPKSRAELMAGARGRAEALQRLAHERGETWRYFVGLEGGLEVVCEHEKFRREAEDTVRNLQPKRRRWVFLQSWAFVSDGAGGEAYGQSGGILLPEVLARHVLDEGIELSAAIDAHAGGRGIRDAQGAWGVLTRDLITRQEAFRIAVIHAFAPYFNATMYGDPNAQRGSVGVWP